MNFPVSVGNFDPSMGKFYPGSPGTFKGGKTLIPQGIILDEQDLRTAVKYFLTQDCFSFDIESSYENRLDPNRNTVTWISLATHGCCVVIPMGHPKGELSGKGKVLTQYKSGAKEGQYYNKTIDLFSDPPQQLDANTVFDILSPLFANPEITKIGHDVLFDLISIAKYLGFVPPGPYVCTKTADWLLNENRWSYGLKERNREEYDFIWDTENTGKCVENYPFSSVAYYSYCDSKMDFLWWTSTIRPALESQDLLPVFKLEMNVLNVLIGMRMEGVSIDVPKLESMKKKLSADLLVHESEIYRAAGRKFNINSNPQKQEILYRPKSEGGQGLKPWKLTDAGKKVSKSGGKPSIYHYSTDDDVMESYPDNPVCAAIRKYGDVYKILNTYVEGWLSAQVDGKLYPGLLQYGTVTGRFSCRKPNLQNIPRGSTELGALVRSVFIAPEGYKLICADYSQIELVILAHYIGKGKLYEAFMRGIDPHLMTAAMVLGREPVMNEPPGSHPEGVTKVERQDLGKTLGFAVVYGAGLGKVSSMAHLDWEGAKRVLKKHAEMFPEIHKFRQDVIDLAKSRKPVPYITTLLGRKRRVPALNSVVDGIRMGAERQLFNSLIQGGATGDLIKVALIRIDAMLPDECKLLLTVHDEILVLAPDEMVDKAVEVVYDGMTGPGIQKLVKVPLKVDLHVGQKWGDIK